MDVEAGTVAAVSTLASHSDPSVVGLVLFHQSCKPPAMVSPTLTTSVASLGEAVAVAVGDLGHAASMPLPLAECIGPWPAAAARSGPRVPSGPYRDPPYIDGEWQKYCNYVKV